MSLERARQAALVQAALRGDEHAREELGALAEEYLRRCFFRHARRCYGDGVKEELEDIASDAVEKCLARLTGFRGEELCSPPGSMGSRRMFFGTTTGRGHAEIKSGRRCGRIRVHGGMSRHRMSPTSAATR